jgi:hypothetical protein
MVRGSDVEAGGSSWVTAAIVAADAAEATAIDANLAKEAVQSSTFQHGSGMARSSRDELS